MFNLLNLDSFSKQREWQQKCTSFSSSIGPFLGWVPPNSIYMGWIMPRSSAFVALLVLSVCAVAPAAQADTLFTYTYAGQPFNTWAGGDSCSGGVGECSLSVTFTLGSALGPNLVDTTVSPLTYTFFDGVNTLNQTNSSIINFFFSTDASSQITAWHATVTDPTYYSPTDPLNMGTGFTGPGNGQDSSTDDPVHNYLAYQVGTFPGTWTVSQASVPEPSSLLLLTGGVMGWIGLGYRRRRPLN